MTGKTLQTAMNANRGSWKFPTVSKKKKFVDFIYFIGEIYHNFLSLLRTITNGAQTAINPTKHWLELDFKWLLSIECHFDRLHQ